MYFISLLIILIFLIGLFFLIKTSKENKEGKENFKKSSSVKNQINQNLVDLSNIKIPYKVKEEIALSTLIKSTTELYKIFKSLDYTRKTKDELLTTIEWNNWEVSQFLYLLQSNRNILMQDYEELFHSSIINLSKEQIINEVKYIILKFNKSVTENEILSLKKQVIWSAKEVSIILYYLSLSKKSE